MTRKRAASSQRDTGTEANLYAGWSRDTAPSRVLPGPSLEAQKSHIARLLRELCATSKNDDRRLDRCCGDPAENVASIMHGLIASTKINVAACRLLDVSGKQTIVASIMDVLSK